MSHHVYHCYLQFDGAALFTLVLLPREGGVFPTVLCRRPYVDDEEFLSEGEIGARWAAFFAPWLTAGYAVVFQHCRGTGKSGGECVPYIHEREDGLFLQEWVRKQSFYNGELYLWGKSYTSSVHFVTAPFAPDIKGAVLEVQDSSRYNCNYRNGFYKMGLHGGWYVKMYKKKQIRVKNYTTDFYKMLPLSDFSRTVFGESAPDFDEILRHPERDDPFWGTRFGGGEARDALLHANIPVLLVTGFYDIYTGGIFDMWRALDEETRKKCALLVHPFDHSTKAEEQPIRFPNAKPEEAFQSYAVRWCDAVRGKGEAPVPQGKITYYKLFDGRYCCDDFYDAEESLEIPLGEGAVTYTYDPRDPAVFAGGLSCNFGGNAWQDAPHKRGDIITVYSPAFLKDTFVKGKMRARLSVSSDCEDTCFYVRLSLCRREGDYGLRDDITKLSNVTASYRVGEETALDFTFDEHAFVIGAGERLRIDISSSAYPHYVPHTNVKGLFSKVREARVAQNTVLLQKSYITLPVKR